MELQWPLILFTTFVSWSAGLFGTQGFAALVGEGKRAQLPALIMSAVLLVIGGIAVFFHLEHWERIFNGFGNPTSGITQELICVVVVVVLMVIAFAMIRKSAANESASALPKWLAICLIIAAVLLVAVYGHSYLMAARPAWNSMLGPLSLLGVACILGPASFVVIEAIVGESSGSVMGLAVLVGSIVNGAATVAYVVFMEISTASYTNVGYYYDPTHPTHGMIDTSSLSPFASDSLAMVIIAILMVVVAIVCALLGRKSGSWKVWGSIACISGVVGAVALRMAFYVVGASVYLFY